MPWGVFIDCLAVLAGGLVGAKYQKKVPHRIKDPLVIMFGIAAIAIGIVSFIKLHSLPAVIMALILGVLIGELLDLDRKVRHIFEKILKRFNFKTTGNHQHYMEFYLVVAVTFCASGTNIFGALHEGMSGDMTILLSKAAMDIFASVIFASTLGYAMIILVVPQCLILTGFFYLSFAIMPYVSSAMLNDFIAVGGLLTLTLGLCIAKIIRISAINLIPALIVIFPISYLVEKIMG